MMGHFSLLPNDDGRHSLLEMPLPAYTTATVRRAFLVWLQCGQQNEFRQVCNYFHRLEAMEDKLSAEDRATSRAHEFHLLSSLPPSSHYLSEHFPSLYRYNKNSKMNMEEVQEITLENCVFNLEGFHDMKIQRGATTKDIIRISQMIRQYCKTHSKSLKNLLAEFQEFAQKTEAANSVDSIAMYVKKKCLNDELVTWSNIPRSFSFLDNSEATDKINVSYTKTEDFRGRSYYPTSNVDHTFRVNENADKIKIMINESRRQEYRNMIPNNYYQNAILSAKFSKIKQNQKPGSVVYADSVGKM